MNEIYVTGHKNPDMDAICSSYCYANLKNQIDHENTYIPIRCGSLNSQTQFVFEHLKLMPPMFKKDILPRVSDVTRRNIITLSMKDSIHYAIEQLDKHTLSFIPVLDDQSNLCGTLSIHEISTFLIAANMGTRPSYTIEAAALQQRLPGRLYQKGDTAHFSGPIMIGAMPFEVSVKRIEALKPQKPILIVGNRKDLIQHAIIQQFPGIILTGIETGTSVDIDFSSYKGIVYLSDVDTAETVRLLRLCSPVEDIMNRDYLQVQSDDDYDSTKRTLVGSDQRGLPVFTGNRFEGIVTRRCFIERPCKRLILTDHNETDQSIDGANQAEIVEIIDHHRLGAGKTKKPIYVHASPVGSTCTLVWQHYHAFGITPSRDIATLLLSGILSDTVILKSPTTTAEDRAAAKQIAQLAGLNIDTWGKEIFAQNEALTTMAPEQIINGDFKVYEQQDIAVGIGQVEVQTFGELPEIQSALLEALENKKNDQKLDWTMLLVTNVLKQDSELLVTAFPRGEKHLFYTKIEDGLYSLPGVLSRKKQLLPEIFRIIDEIHSE